MHSDKPGLRLPLGLLEQAGDRARQAGRSILASYTEPFVALDPVEVFGRAEGLCAERVLWLQPEMDLTLLGLGNARILEAQGPERFSVIADSWKSLCADATIANPERLPGTGPTLLGGFSFTTGQPRTSTWRDFAEGRMILPRVCLAQTHGQAWLTVNFLIGAGDDVEIQLNEAWRLRRLLLAGDAPSPAPDRVPNAAPVLRELQTPERWRAEVGAAAAAARGGRIKKVVLARTISLHASAPFSAAAAVRQLAGGYPTCVTFAVGFGERCFVGATPEQLLRVRDRLASATCLAGSYPRSASDELDRKLGQTLLADPKEREEHALVREALVRVLTQTCRELKAPDSPVVLKLPNVQHLCTKVSGRLMDTESLLSVVGRLHPTPAVGGEPRAAALEMISRREGLERGWYSGLVGWLDTRGEGEFVVAIRAALLHAHEALLFAGCGIVADSDPAREFDESCIKLTPMLSALGAA